MQLSETTRTNILKALRIFLVFTLVFWSTLHVETLAFAEGEETPAGEQPQTPGAGGGESPSTDQPTDPPASDEPTGDNPSGDDPSGDDPSGSDSPSSDDPTNPGEGGQQGTEGGNEGGTGGGETPQPTADKYEDFQLYLPNEHPDPNSTDKFKYLGSMVGSAAKGQQPSQVPQIQTAKGELTFHPILVVGGERVAVSTDDIEWNILNGGAAIADFTESGGKKTNVLQAKGEKDAEIAIECTLKKTANEKYGLSKDRTVKLGFSVSVVNQSGPQIEAIELLDKSGNALPGGETLDLALENGTVEYQFYARLTIRESANDDAKKHTVTTMDAKSASDDDKKFLEALTWSVDDTDNASIDATGLFKTSKRIITTVKCTADANGESKIVAMARVNTGVDTKLQGDYNPQNSLTILAPSDAMVATKDGGKSDEAESKSNQATGASGEGTTDATGTPDPSGATGGTGDGASDGKTEGEPEKPEVVEKRYTLDNLPASFQATNVLTGRSPSASNAGGNAGGDSSSANSTTIKGEGPTLAALLADAGIDPAKVRTLTFYSAGGSSKTVNWSDLGDGALLATRSVVLSSDDADGLDASSLLDNTRFRLLPGDGLSYDTALPWINEVSVNGATKGGSGSGKAHDGSLQPVIFYNPVPQGYTAVLTAAVVGLFEGEQFGLKWEQSNDGGATWSNSGDTAQTLRVPCSSATIGRMYRVTVTTNLDRENVSEPVTIREPDANKFAVNLAYDPPLAGEIAFFTTTVTGVNASEVTDYIWEFTENGGDTWSEIAGSRGRSTFSAKTDPVTSSPDSGGTGDEAGKGTGDTGEGAGSGEASDSEKEVERTPASSMWVRVRVQATNGREAISNPVMLTVHVGDEAGSGQAPTEDIPDDLNDQPSAPGSDTPVVPPTETDKPSNSAQSPSSGETQPTETPVVQEVTSITVESAPRSQSTTSTVVTSETPATEQRPDGTQTTPTPESAPSESVTDLIVNPEVTAEILQQREAVNAAVQATQPGARWTALTTVDPDGKDVQRILNDNPFAPFAAPFALGITAAGALESFLGFRRKIR